MHQEMRSMEKCRRAGLRVPALYLVDIESRKIFLEYIEGITVKSYIIQEATVDFDFLSSLIGQTIAKMHDANIIHGDLTTSNMMLTLRNSDTIGNGSNNFDLVMIDFGLSFISSSIEDKAVDLYVLERAFLSTHPNSESVFTKILSDYEMFSKNAVNVIKRLDEVRMRGRKKIAFG